MNITRKFDEIDILVHICTSKNNKFWGDEILCFDLNLNLNGPLNGSQICFG